MVVTLLEDDQPEFFINLADLHTLEETGFEDAAEIGEQRPIDGYIVETLTFSDPRAWPPILVTKTDIGYVVLDGGHRWEAAKERNMEQIKATSKTFKTEDDVIRAAYTANFLHGNPASKGTRSSYARWLHKKNPQMKQRDIGRLAGISQATVSEALSRPEALPAAKPVKTPKLKGLVPGQLIPPGTQPEEEQKRQHTRKDWKTFARDVKKIMEDNRDLDEVTQRALAMETFGNIEDREVVLALIHFLEGILEPPKPPTRRSPRKRQEE